MFIKVGTFNLNNLFSRFNFTATISAIQQPTSALTVRYEFTDKGNFRIRTFKGNLVKAKADKDTDAIADRIVNVMDADVLAIQEAENIDILREFNRDKLNNLYKHVVLVEGNDPRLIDVGLLSKFPIGAVTSFQTAVHPSDTSKRVFGRDLLEVEVLNASRTMRLFTIYNNHLKSHFGDDDNGGQGQIDNDDRRTKQAETVQRIVGERMRTDSRYIVVGDMNDDPSALPLTSLKTIEGQAMFNALSNPAETRPPKAESTGINPTTTAWTHRFLKNGVPEHKLFDQIWLSPALSPAFVDATIDRRTKHGGDGSDHDPAWITLDL